MIGDPKLTAYALDELNEPDRAQVEAWLNDHPEGWAEVTEIQAMAQLLTSSFEGDATPKARSRKAWWLLLPLAAAAAGIIFWPSGPEQRPEKTDAFAYTLDESGQKQALSVQDALEHAEIDIIPFDEVPEEIRLAHEADIRRQSETLAPPILDMGKALAQEKEKIIEINEEMTVTGEIIVNWDTSFCIAGSLIETDEPAFNRVTQLDDLKYSTHTLLPKTDDQVTQTVESILDNTSLDYGYLPRNAVPGNLSTGDIPKGRDQISLAPGNDGTKVSVYGAIGPENGYLLEGERITGSDELEPVVAVTVEQEGDTETYAHREASPFYETARNPLSTFSIDVDTASFSNVRRFLDDDELPPEGAVRVEEMVNYFDYLYPLPARSETFGVSIDVTSVPWHPSHRLARIGLKGFELDPEQRPATNLVFLIDVSGSMYDEEKLPLVRYALRQLTQQLRPEDSVAVVVYAGSSGVVLQPTRGSAKTDILACLDRLQAGGSTNGGEGIEAAYALAQSAFIEGGINRVVLATDGDFNVGMTSESELLKLIEAKAKTGVFLTVLGFGMGDYNDETLEMLADKGNGFYAYIDSESEADRVLVHRLMSSLVTIAKDVKIQVEFNPKEVSAYRLIGYENRMLEDQDFNDDTKDAGEVGAGHCVTALYEIVPVGEVIPVAETDPLKYQTDQALSEAAFNDELFTMKIRFKAPDSDSSQMREFVGKETHGLIEYADQETKFAVAVACFAMKLRGELDDRDMTWSLIAELAREGLGADRNGDRDQVLAMIKKAAALAKEDQ
ncbi:MAG: von Willebrand factor type A domain-containing protein [Acidobacteria bacterium]|nr:von Willebrand factor type A domain-containing protein [Acidobacteriota bacterium]